MCSYIYKPNCLTYLKENSSAHQAYIYLIRNALKSYNIVKYYYNVKYNLFLIKAFTVTFDLFHARLLLLTPNL